MYNIRRQTKKFDTDDIMQLGEYDDIINNPLCSVIVERREKLRETDYNEDGKIASSRERIIMVVTWDEKVLS